MSTLFESTDVDAAYDMLSQLYRVRRFSTPGERPFVRIGQDDLGPARLHRLSFAMSCDAGGEPLRAYYLGHVISGSVAHHDRQGSRAWTTGDAFLVTQPDQPFATNVETADVEFVSLGPEILARIADTAPSRAPRPIRFTGYRPAVPRDNRLWVDTCGYARAVVAAGPGAPPLLLAGVADLLAAAALTAFPNTALHDPTIEDRHDAHPASLRRAVCFIDDHAGRDIGPADIAAAAHVTIRALQLAFRRHLGTTPTAYVRRVRLQHAHDALRAADPADGTRVGDIAARWGFLNHSRFAADYRAAYGVAPSQTLRR
ncbi:helix-turn-helix transcriptional regulator [Actinoplanes sp. CA-054009]